MDKNKEYKQCTICNIVKNIISDFPKNGRIYRSICKICHTEKEKERYQLKKEEIVLKKKDYYDKNKSEILNQMKIYRDDNKEILLDKKREYYKKNRDIILEKVKSKDYKQKRNKFLQNKRKIDKKFCLISAYRARLSEVLRKQKRNTYIHYLDCTREQLLDWIEFQFDYATPKLLWESYGKVWVIDHVIPINFFNLDNDIEKARCFNWYNLRPCLLTDNLTKSDKIDFNIIENHSKILQEFKKKNKWYQTDIEIYQWLREKLR